MKVHKTNAMRDLEKLSIKYEAFSYEPEDGKIDGVSVAAKLGVESGKVYKTLVAHCDGENFVFIIPVECELDFKKAAKCAGVKRMEMLPLKELTKTTGYVRGGCSPLAMKKKFPSFIDSSAEDLDSIFVSAGKIGLQILIGPDELARAIDAPYVSVVKEE